MRHPQKSAFSLVELSIVLVILGLLVGGILAGQSLIRAAELRSISSDLVKYRTAVLAFRDKYMAMPGDMSNAYNFWGSSCNSNPTYCNGNGDRIILFDQNSVNVQEQPMAWHHMELAGLVEGKYTGIISGTQGPGISWPASRVNGGGFYFTYPASTNNCFSNGYPFYYYATNKRNRYDNALMFGSWSNYCPRGAIISPEEAWNIDSKMDDGQPYLGTVKAGGPLDGNTNLTNNCTNSGWDNWSTIGSTIPAYTFATKAPACILIYELRI